MARAQKDNSASKGDSTRSPCSFVYFASWFSSIAREYGHTIHKHGYSVPCMGDVMARASYLHCTKYAILWMGATPMGVFA